MISHLLDLPPRGFRERLKVIRADAQRAYTAKLRKLKVRYFSSLEEHKRRKETIAKTRQLLARYEAAAAKEQIDHTQWWRQRKW